MQQRKYIIAAIGSRLDSFLTGIVRTGGFKLTYEIVEGEVRFTDFENPEVLVKFSGQDVELLLANKAEMLLALEHLAAEMLRMPPEDHARLFFDANDYRALRIEELRLSAITAADRVRKSGMPFTFSPMNSRERRILHLAVNGEEGVRSESTGAGTFRQVVIYPANMPTPPQTAVPARPAPAGRRRRH